MPRSARTQLRWSEQAQNYILFMGDPASEQVLSSDRLDWLEQVASFSFHCRSGMHYTARKQKVQRGNDYWYAYRRLHERIVKRYLGRAADLTLARLEDVARLLESVFASHQSSLSSVHVVALSQSTPHISCVENAEFPAPVTPFPLLLSKLSPPRLHTLLLERSRLFALLDAGRECALTLLSAPAGFGKTTLVGQWMTARRASPDFPPVAWVSLETADNDPMRFWRYLIAACQTFQIDLAQVHSALIAMKPQPPFVPSSLEAMLTILLNALAQCPSGGILVLEDYHVIAEHAIHEMVAFFLDHLPVTVHLIIITRSDPPFSLARLRARNLLYEVRTADLRFSQEETAMLFQQVHSISLEDPIIQRMHTQLDGWGVGLHLVKLALQRADTQASKEQQLALFSGSNASLQEYFVTEVLDLQLEAVQQFVLQTSVLTRLTASLCDAVIEQQNSQDMLSLLERANLFLEPLDTAGQWYRYHALFAEAMRYEARRRFGEEQLHHLSARASLWYEQHGYRDEAIDAALDAHEYMRAASLIEQSIEEYVFPGEIQEPHTLHRWLEQLPETVLEQHQALCLSYATTLLFLSASWLPDAQTQRSLEKLLQRAEQRFRMERHLSKLGELMALRTLVALRQGDVQAAIKYAKEALDWFAQAQSPIKGEQRIWRGLSLSVVAEEWIGMGHIQQARAALLEAHALCEAMENHYFKRTAMIKLARVCFELGEFQQARSLYRQVLAEARVEESRYVYCNALVGLAALCYECNELESTYQHAQEAMTISQSSHLLYYEVQATLILVRVQQAQGQTFVAQQQLAALLDKVPVSFASFPDLAQEILAAQAQLALSIGDPMAAQRWATGRVPHHDFSQRMEEELLLCRWLRTQGRLEEASRQLEHLLVATGRVGHVRRMLEIQVEMVLVAAASKRKTEAQDLLRATLAQALGLHAMRLFLDAGQQMAILLRSLLPQIHDQPLLSYIRALLSAFPVQQQNSGQAQAASLVEPLSPQEMRVLRLLVQRRSNAEIARELVVSVNTVRTQVQSIYNKLGVHSRSAASEVARELRLIS
jgi:LuxR family maltose regulon positive regulatory protein